MLHILIRRIEHLGPMRWASVRWPRARWGGPGAVVLAYLVTLGGFLVFTDWLPFVLDNNETYSSLIHARNIHRFGVGETFGLTDESYGLEPAQHPYVYTHGGNFPRFYALFLYVLGARTAETQIAITTFTVGLTGMLFAYFFLSRVANPLFAAVYCLLLMTDYVMQTQWLVSTWRVWHTFFFFSGLLCAEGLTRSGPLPRWLAVVTLANFACLAYLEIVFACFVGLMTILYVGAISRRQPRRVLQAWLLVGGGAALGASILIGQLVGYLGWNGFLEDVRLTFFARNVPAEDLPALRREIWSFKEENRLVFWHNFFSSAPNHLELMRWTLLPYTPVLVFIVWLIAAGWALSLLPTLERVDAPAGSVRGWWSRNLLPVVAAAAAVFALATLLDRSFAGLPEGGRELGGVPTALAAAAGLAAGGLGLAIHRRGRLREEGLRAPAPGRVIAASVVLLGFAALARSFPHVYGEDSAIASMFEELISETGGATAWHLAVLLGAVVAAALVLRPGLMGRDRQSVARLFQFSAAGLVALAAVVEVFPGYVVSGYFSRYCPLTVYVQMVPLAAGFHALIRIFVHSLKSLAASPNGEPTSSDARGPVWPVSAVVSSALLLGLLAFYWIRLQGHWMARHDPHATVLKHLAQPHYRGASFAVNAYAAPVAFITKGWAYFDPQMGQSELRDFGGKFYLRRDFGHMWLADKRSNMRYFEPNYYLCWIHRKLLDPVVGGLTCQDYRLVAEARAGTSRLAHREVARDESGQDQWSIVMLNWTYPPGSGKKVQWDGGQYYRTLGIPW